MTGNGSRNHLRGTLRGGRGCSGITFSATNQRSSGDEEDEKFSKRIKLIHLSILTLVNLESDENYLF